MRTISLRSAQELAAARDDNEDLMESTNEEKTSLSTRISELESTLEKTNNASFNLKTQLETKIAELDQKLVALDALNQAGTSKITELEAELVAQVANTAENEKYEATITDLNSQLKKHKTDLREVSTLLGSSNEAIDEARANVVLLESKLKETEQELEDAMDMAGEFKDSGAENADALLKQQVSLESYHNIALQQPANPIQLTRFSQMDTLTLKNERIEAKLASTTEDRLKSEEDLRKLMGEEQRALISETETAMNNLQERLRETEAKVSDAETTSYENRQRCEDMIETCRAAESGAASAKQENDELKEMTQLIESQLFGMKEENVELKELCALAEQRAEMEAKAARSNISKAASSNSKSNSSTNNSQSEEIEKIKAEHKKEVATKNARIKKLEAVRLTKEQCAALKKMKSERASFQQQAVSGEKKIVELKKKLRDSMSGSITNDNENNNSSEKENSGEDELIALRTAKESLGEKLKKYAAHCQTLEAEKSTILTKLNIDADDNFVNGVSELVGKLAATEKERDSLVGVESEAGIMRAQIETMKGDLDKFELSR